MARGRKKLSAKAKQERGEAKAVKFKELAAKRANAAIGRIRLLRNLANRNSYSYTEDQVEHLITALQNELDAVTEAFKAPSKSEASAGFSFD